MTELSADTKFKYRDRKGVAHDVDPEKISLSNMFVLAQRGLTHILGNEVASALTAWKKSEEGQKATADECEAWAQNKQDEKLQQILTGQLGVRASGGPRVSGIEAIRRAIAVEFLKARLAKYSAKTGNKVKLPTGDDTLTIAGKPMTRDQLIESELRARKDDIEAEAQRRQRVQQEGADVGDDLFGEDESEGE